MLSQPECQQLKTSYTAIRERNLQQTTANNYAATSAGCGLFIPLRFAPGRVALPITDIGFVDVAVPLGFTVYGDTPLSMIRVYADGCIGISSDLTATLTAMGTNNAANLAIEVNMLGSTISRTPRISAAHENLIPNSSPGVFTLSLPGAFIVSWETQFANPAPIVGSIVRAQVVLSQMETLISAGD
jgi:hypothetical protein